MIRTRYADLGTEYKALRLLDVLRRDRNMRGGGNPVACGPIRPVLERHRGVGRG
ncbi:MAG TPA: hypothetical protein VHV82_19445 [Sporichthyaceae bacterium]|nr:hypothetical protein [Sporichthyaceae bacterium]